VIRGVSNEILLMETKTRRFPQYVAGLSAACGAFCAGTILGWSSPIGPRLLDEQQYFPITPDEWSWIAAIYNVGCGISSIFIGYCMDIFGRKWTMIYLSIPFVIGWCMLIWAQNFLMMLIGRFILGVAGGAFYISVPQYTSEIAEKEIRGILGSFLQLLISLGVLFVYIIGAYLSVFTTNVICGLCPIIFAIIFINMPETPLFYVMKNDEAKAIKSLKWLRGKDFNETAEIAELSENLKNNQEKVPFLQAIKEKSSINALIIGCGLLFFRHMSCIIPILFYATTIFAVRFFCLIKKKYFFQFKFLGVWRWIVG
jgi:SP family facilitated glucose transporter-like MFS transporter 8